MEGKDAGRTGIEYSIEGVSPEEGTVEGWMWYGSTMQRWGCRTKSLRQT